MDVQDDDAHYGIFAYRICIGEVKHKICEKKWGRGNLIVSGG
jgi:hypothetical protein